MRFITESDKGSEHAKALRLGFGKEGKLIFFTIVIKSTVEANQPANEKTPVRDAFDALVAELKEELPVGLKLMYQEADIFWAWMQSEQAFFDGAIQGMSISGVLAFLIILIATRNILISIYAITSVIFIVLCVVGVMVINDWQLGVSESIAMVIIIGFSVDYVVHLAAHYIHSPPQNRYDRSTDSIASMGVSIFSGGMTTLGSGVFLFGGKIIFFQKFA